MTDHLEDRGYVLEQLRRELVGPSPAGEDLDLTRPVTFESQSASYGPWKDAATGEEIIQRDSPTKRYGVAVLFPMKTAATEDDVTEGEAEADLRTADDSASDPPPMAEIESRPSRGDVDSDDFDLSTANDYRPSSMAITFLVKARPETVLDVRASGGRYSPFKVSIASDMERTWWVRSPVSIQATFLGTDLLTGSAQVVRPAAIDASNTDGLDLSLVAFARPRNGGEVLLTISLVNRHVSSAPGNDALCLFQATFEARPADGLILPYPERQEEPSAADEEERSFALLYRDARTFAIGHGCAADWSRSEDGETAECVSAEALPTAETPSITPAILRPDGSELTVPMGPLAGLAGDDDGVDRMTEVVDAYELWIAERDVEVQELTGGYRATALLHLEQCRAAASRMRDGLDLLRADPVVARAFRLANEAVLLQQLRTRTTPREVVIDRTGRYRIDEDLAVLDWRSATGRGAWRPFQLAFILMALPSVADGRHPDRDLVELIWFPTGGGKTEAYLGLSAFAMFLRRLRDPDDSGTEVLMRYTLRLLTTQQFLRASALVCAMETLRVRDPALGKERFSIGIWLGGSATPNSRQVARYNLRSLNKGDKYVENQFLLLRCPWCSAQMGPVKAEPKAPKRTPRVSGYVEEAGTVVFRCPDTRCEFSRSNLPAFVIDEDIYDHRPTMVIGTVDKFAMLAWNPTARSLFGINGQGERSASPPGTIVQDELHLISGPLGSVVGLYEAIIEDLCTDRRCDPPLKPKIVSSTATIRRFEQQVSALYGRERVMLFPPRGLSASDSFFARYARDGEGNLRPGRLYVGVHAPGLGSVQTAQVRTFAALLQAPVPFDPIARDPWWTSLVFFNSLRELGTSLSLVQSDIPDYLRVIQNRYGLAPNEVRQIRVPKELTSRLRQDEVPRAIDELSQPAGAGDVVDICLASNIIEVGVDIDRLSLMCVVGQPKTTSQYIQVSGRVGRRWAERPGLVVTILSPSKPRDRSHFERFKSYHKRLYAQVEPTSVTPFAPPVLARALHAALCVYVRQNGPSDLTPWPIPDELVSAGADLLRDRAGLVDSAEADSLDRTLAARVREWESWERTDWSGTRWGDDGKAPLLRRAGEWAPAEVERVTWETPTSMRNVDAECMVQVTNLYVVEKAGEQP